MKLIAQVIAKVVSLLYMYRLAKTSIASCLVHDEASAVGSGVAHLCLILT